MLTEQELLQSIYKTTDMGRGSIQNVLRFAGGQPFRQALEQQRTEYDQILSAAGDLLRERDEIPQGVHPLARASTDIMSAMKTLADRSDSKIAEMMIQGNTMGMTKSIRNLHEYNGLDDRVRGLADKLLQTEEANIQQMKEYL